MASTVTDRRVLLDTGPLVVHFSEDDAHHERPAALEAVVPPLLTCWPVLTEAAWVLRSCPHCIHQLLDGFRGGLFALLPLAQDDLPAIAAIIRRDQEAARNSPLPKRCSKIATLTSAWGDGASATGLTHQ